MKRFLASILAAVLVICLGAITAYAADPPYNGTETGNIAWDGSGVLVGTLSGTYSLSLAGQVTGSGAVLDFTGTVSGDITGTLAGQINTAGTDTLSGTITVAGVTDAIRIFGCFSESGSGSFSGQIATGSPTPVLATGITIHTAGDATSVLAGGTLQLTAQTKPDEAQDNVLWCVDNTSIASIDQNGLLNGLQAGTAHVIAKTLDGSLMSTDVAITVTEPKTEIKAAVNPTYTIVIPAEVNFGTLQKGQGVKEKPFAITASNLFIEDGSSIQIGVDSNFELSSGASVLPFKLYNSTSAVAEGIFTTITASHTQEDGKISIDTGAIQKPGDYEGTMTFSIKYVD